MSDCKKQSEAKYRERNSPPFPANKCKTLKKRGNDGFMYKSISNKNGVFRWVKWSSPSVKTRKLSTSKKLTLKELKFLTDKYRLKSSGTKKELAERLIHLRGHRMNKTDLKKVEQILA